MEEINKKNKIDKSATKKDELIEDKNIKENRIDLKEESSQESNKTKKNFDNLQEEIDARKRKAKIFLGINFAIFFLVLIVLVFVLQMFSKSGASNNRFRDYDNSNDDNKALLDLNLVERKIDGVFVSENEAKGYLIAAMIDNHLDARPPSGIDKAHLVFEAEVEGSLTRLMAVFSSSQDIEEIGPIRSARPYFLDWARELNALYAHVGGSPDALVKIQQDRILNINEFFNGEYYWRAEDRPMPHNVYTSTENLEKWLSEKSADRNKYIPWAFKDDEDELKRPDSASVNIDYKIKSSRVEWKYDKEDNSYIRYVSGQPHRSKDGKLIVAKNIIVQVADAKELDDKLRLEMNNIGTGQSLVCMDGNCVKGTWQKKHPSDRTRFYLEDGKEAKYNRGMSWIQVVRPEVEYSFD